MICGWKDQYWFILLNYKNTLLTQMYNIGQHCRNGCLNLSHWTLYNQTFTYTDILEIRASVILKFDVLFMQYLIVVYLYFVVINNYIQQVYLKDKKPPTHNTIIFIYTHRYSTDHFLMSPYIKYYNKRETRYSTIMNCWHE